MQKIDELTAQGSNQNESSFNSKFRFKDNLKYQN